MLFVIIGQSMWFEPGKKLIYFLFQRTLGSLVCVALYKSVNNFFEIYSEVVDKAMEMWSSASGLTLQKANTNAFELNISFVSKDHDDGSPFDGNGKYSLIYVLIHFF